VGVTESRRRGTVGGVAAWTGVCPSAVAGGAFVRDEVGSRRPSGRPNGAVMPRLDWPPDTGSAILDLCVRIEGWGW
jgi:hypothetical protein